jgi:hypothetical protein
MALLARVIGSCLCNSFQFGRTSAPKCSRISRGSRVWVPVVGSFPELIARSQR